MQVSEDQSSMGRGKGILWNGLINDGTSSCGCWERGKKTIKDLPWNEFVLATD